VIAAVVFDLDGTLVRLPIDYERLFEEFQRIMKVDDVRPVTERVAKLDAGVRAAVFEVWDRAELAVLGGVAVNAEGMRLYEDFVGKPKGLVTMQGKKLVKAVIEKLGLAFDAVVTREDSLDRTEQLKIVAERLKTQIPSVLFVGNTDSDAVAAAKAGCQFVKVK